MRKTFIISNTFILSIENVNKIIYLIKLLEGKGAVDKANEAKERLNELKQQELAKKKASALWWKKMFRN